MDFKIILLRILSVKKGVEYVLNKIDIREFIMKLFYFTQEKVLLKLIPGIFEGYALLMLWRRNIRTFPEDVVNLRGCG